jgi:ABC-2 type transport system ATP-binding protein
MNGMITFDRLGKTYGDFTAVRDLSLSIERGEVFGFLGPNGAGKTTTIRMMMGILVPTSGHVTIDGLDAQADRVELKRRVGYLPDNPMFYDFLRGREIVEFIGEMQGQPRDEARKRAGALLDELALDEASEEYAVNYSTGMKKKLGLACALVHDPAVLILDEPTNGLDPHGILEMRRLLAALNRERGVTILVSSHILAEIERLVTHVGVIHQGQMRFEGTLDALRARQAFASVTTVDTSDNTRAAAVAAAAGFDARVDDGRGGRLVLPALSRDEAARLAAALVLGGLALYEIATVRRDLEQIFLDLIGGAA